MLCGVAGLLLANLNAFASPSTLAWSVSGELIVIVVIGGLGTVFGPLMGALVFLGLEEVLKGFTEHWMVIFGPLIVIVALLGKRGIVGLLERFDARATSAAPAPATAEAAPHTLSAAKGSP
jgi:branched-chain amino acid transport system permease protein